MTPGTTPERPGKTEQPVGPSVLRPDLVTDCDRLAAHPSDEQRPSDVAGVFENEIDIVAALRACSEAIRQYPDVARFAFESGRIAHAQKDYAEALRSFEKARGMGSKIAITETGIAYLNGESVERDYARARQLFEEAEAKGDFLAVGSYGLALPKRLGRFARLCAGAAAVRKGGRCRRFPCDEQSWHRL